MANDAKAQVKEPVPVKINDVLTMLDEGKTREDIRIHYNISKAALNRLFQHEKLKGKKTKGYEMPSRKKDFSAEFAIEDDAPDAEVYKAPVRKAKTDQAEAKPQAQAEAVQEEAPSTPVNDGTSGGW